jgi:integrase
MDESNRRSPTKRAYGTGSVGFHKGSQLWCGRWIGRDGTRHNVYADTERAAGRAMADARSREGEARAATAATTSSDPLVLEWLATWVEGTVGHPSKWRFSTRHHARDLIAAVAESGLWEGRRFSTITLFDVQKLLNAVSTPTWNRHWGPQTIYHLRATLSAAMGDAIRLGVVPSQSNPVLGATVPSLKAPTRTALEPEQRQALLDEALRRDETGALVHRLGDLVAFLMLTGLRSGEARALSYRHINLDLREIRVERTITRTPETRLGFGPTKSDASNRPVAIRGRALEILQLRAQAEGLFPELLGDRDWEGATKPDGSFVENEESASAREGHFEVFTQVRPGKWGLVKPYAVPGRLLDRLVWRTGNNGPLDGKALSKALCKILTEGEMTGFDQWRCRDQREVIPPGGPNWKNAPFCSKCKTQHWPPFNVHTLRSIAISYWIAKGATDLAAARRAGHSDVAMVQRVYGLSSRTQDDEIADFDDDVREPTAKKPTAREHPRINSKRTKRG